MDVNLIPRKIILNHIEVEKSKGRLRDLWKNAEARDANALSKIRR